MTVHCISLFPLKVTLSPSPSPELPLFLWFSPVVYLVPPFHLCAAVATMRRQDDSPCSSIDSSFHPCLESTTPISQRKEDLSTELMLGLGISSSFSYQQQHCPFNSRDYDSRWVPSNPNLQQRATFFVKVYMEGIPIGRKLDLFAQRGYEDLVKTLRGLFTTIIKCLDPDQLSVKKTHVLAYEDKEGDWMLVGDVPWDMFLSSVKRLKITRADRL